MPSEQPTGATVKRSSLPVQAGSRRRSSSISFPSSAWKCSLACSACLRIQGIQRKIVDKSEQSSGSGIPKQSLGTRNRSNQESGVRA